MSSVDNSQDWLVISEAARMLSRAGDPGPAIRGVLRLVSELVGLNRGRVLLPRESDGYLSIHYSYGLRRAEREQGIYAPGEGVTGRIMETGQAHIVQDVDTEPGFLFRAVSRDTLPQQTVCFLGLPIQHDDDTIGVIGFHRLRDRPRAFDDDMQLAGVIAALVGQTIRIDSLVHERTRQLEQKNHALSSALARNDVEDSLLGVSPAFQKLREEAVKFAETDVTIMLSGETGTGKEKFAQLIHRHSPRATGPLISVNSAAIPEHLLEAEIFGYERGAFTGADRTRPGLAEAADGGTLFLDEIGDMSPDLQSKLLRLLQDHEIQRLGSTKKIPVDIRIITATHKNLQQAVNEGKFRSDLYYRLNVIPLLLPPLRERQEDIRILAIHFLSVFAHRYKKTTNFGTGVIPRLQSFHWPGNIRQLENVIERAVLRATTSKILASEIEKILSFESFVNPQDGETHSTDNGQERSDDRNPQHHRPYRRVDDIEPQTLETVLKECHGNKTRAAMRLGLTPRQFYYRLKKLGIN